MLLKTLNEETARYFLQASAETRVTRRSRSVQRLKFFGYEKYEEAGRRTERAERETRALDYPLPAPRFWKMGARMKAIVAAASLAVVIACAFADAQARPTVGAPQPATPRAGTTQASDTSRLYGELVRLPPAAVQSRPPGPW